MIHWTALAQVTVATLIATVIVVGAVSVGILALSQSTGDVPVAHRRRLRAAGYCCLTIAALAVLFGIYLIVPQFH
jgi:hypothetical protein